MFDGLKQKIRKLLPADNEITWTGTVVDGVASICNVPTGEQHKDITESEAMAIIGDEESHLVYITVRKKVE